MAFIDYENGVQGFMGVFSGTKLADRASLNVRILGTEGSMQFNAFRNEIRLAKMDQVDIIAVDPDQNPLAAEWRECIGAIRENRKPITDGIYGHNVVAVLEAMAKSSAAKEEVVPELL
jgi:predicted dehydrogenase